MTTCHLGRYADGSALVVTLDQLHVLVSGLSGTGKSSTLRTLLVGAALDPHVALVLIDAKRVELRAWAPRATRTATEPDDITDTLEAVVALIEARYARMEAWGTTSWPVSSTAPRIVVAVDELAALTASGDKTADKANTSALRHVLERGRAAGVVMVAAIQRPSYEVLPASVRDLYQARILHALADRTSTEMAAGAAWITAPAHTLPVGPKHAGLCYVVLDGNREGRLARCYWTEPHQAAALAQRTAHLRHAWPNAKPQPRVDPFATPPNGTPQPPRGPVAAVQAPAHPSDRRNRTGSHSAPALDEDETAVLAALVNAGSVRAGLLHVRAGLPEGRARRAAQRLERRQLVTRDASHWKVNR